MVKAYRGQCPIGDVDEEAKRCSYFIIGQIMKRLDRVKLRLCHQCRPWPVKGALSVTSSLFNMLYFLYPRTNESNSKNQSLIITMVLCPRMVDDKPSQIGITKYG